MVVFSMYVYHAQNVENHTNLISLQKKYFLKKMDPYLYLKKKPTIKVYSKTIPITDEKILRPDFGKIIREARMKKGLTQENVANQLSEKITLYKKIETGGIKPNDILSKKLERYLGIQLYENLVENNKNEDD